MEIVYTSHLELRLKIRNIPYGLPRKVFKEAKEYYYDNSTKHYIAIHQVEFNGKLREMALTFDKDRDLIELVTIHPIKLYQKQSRIKSGRWRKL